MATPQEKQLAAFNRTLSSKQRSEQSVFRAINRLKSAAAERPASERGLVTNLVEKRPSVKRAHGRTLGRLAVGTPESEIQKYLDSDSVISDTGKDTLQPVSAIDIRDLTTSMPQGIDQTITVTGILAEDLYQGMELPRGYVTTLSFVVNRKLMMKWLKKFELTTGAEIMSAVTGYNWEVVYEVSILTE